MRQARAVPFARMNIERLILDMRFRKSSDWPSHLQMANQLLRDRLSCSEQTALQLVSGGLRAARACGSKIDDRSRAVAQTEALTTLRKKLKRWGNCAKRASAGLRRDLDTAATELLRRGPIDAETTDSLVDATVATFVKYQHEEPAKTALSVLLDSWDEVCDTTWNDGRAALKLQFESLSSPIRIRLETRLSELASAKSVLTATEVFFAISTVLDAGRTKVDPTIAPLLVDYVANLKEQWRATGLDPTRARHPNDPAYFSKFHLFADLILAAVIDPWTRRHDGADQILQHKKNVLNNHRKLPEKIRQEVRPRLRRSDWERLVSDYHLRRGQTPQKSAPTSP
jgi:hypothetical protein